MELDGCVMYESKISKKVVSNLVHKFHQDDRVVGLVGVGRPSILVNLAKNGMPKIPATCD